jgi:hypothetical protein
MLNPGRAILILAMLGSQASTTDYFYSRIADALPISGATGVTFSGGQIGQLRRQVAYLPGMSIAVPEAAVARSRDLGTNLGRNGAGTDRARPSTNPAPRPRSRKSGQWQDEDYDVFDGERCVGRICLIDGWQ